MIVPLRSIRFRESVMLGSQSVESIDINDANEFRKRLFQGIRMELETSSGLVSIVFRSLEPIYVHMSSARYAKGLAPGAASGEVETTHYVAPKDDDDPPPADSRPLTSVEVSDDFPDDAPAAKPRKASRKAG